jgi:hypothetical protein
MRGALGIGKMEHLNSDIFLYPLGAAAVFGVGWGIKEWYDGEPSAPGYLGEHFLNKWGRMVAFAGLTFLITFLTCLMISLGVAYFIHDLSVLETLIVGGGIGAILGMNNWFPNMNNLIEKTHSLLAGTGELEDISHVRKGLYCALYAIACGIAGAPALLLFDIIFG